MKKLNSLAVFALMAPVIALGAGSAFAQESSTTPDRTQEQRSTQEQQQRTMPNQAQNENGMMNSDRAQEHMRTERTQMNGNAHGAYLSSQPADALRAAELIGSDLKSRSNSETIGTINDLLIDKNGKVVAAIVEVGGFLGLGEKEVAISWDSVEHRMNEQGDEHEYTVSATKDALTNAPEFKSEANKY